MKKQILLLFTFLQISNFAKAQIHPDDLLGYWITEDDNVVVQCYKANEKYFAKVVWYGPFQEENLRKMSPKERAGIQTKYINAIVLRDFSFKDDEWAGGKIIQVFEDKTYSAWIEKSDSKEMKVTGFIFFRWLSESTTLRRCQRPDGTTRPKAI